MGIDGGVFRNAGVLQYGFMREKQKPSVFIVRDDTGQMSDNVMLMVAIFDTPFHRFDKVLEETL